MTTKNKARGNYAEAFVVDACKAKGIQAERAWGSDGRAMGLTAKDDGLLGWLRWQCKRVKKPSAWFNSLTEYFAHGIKIITVYVDRREGHPRNVYVIMELEQYLEVMRLASLYGREKDGSNTG